jgi:hypothetical protein
MSRLDSDDVAEVTIALYIQRAIKEALAVKDIDDGGIDEIAVKYAHEMATRIAVVRYIAQTPRKVQP